MRLVIIRHGDPDYDNDRLTDYGIEQVNQLSKLYNANDFDYIYSSTMGRAKETCDMVIKGLKPVKYVDFLREFYYPVLYKGKRVSNFDFDPLYFESSKVLHNNYKYLDSKIMKSAKMKEKYNYVISEFDKVLSFHGYTRSKGLYRIDKRNDDTICMFCHFGTMSVILSHLFNIPYTLITQHFLCFTTGVTTLVTQEYNGYAYFRMTEYGNRKHLPNKMNYIEK